jgi:hypothetical protein
MHTYLQEAVLRNRIRIRIHRFHLFLVLLDPDHDPLIKGLDPDPLVRGTDPDPSSVADPGCLSRNPDPTFSIHPGSLFFPSRIRTKEFKYFNPQKIVQLTQVL